MSERSYHGDTSRSPTPRCQNDEPSVATGPNLGSRAGVLGSSCSNGRETHVLREHCDRVHCRNKASNCPRAKVQVVSAECPPSDASEHCSRTRRCQNDATRNTA